MPDKSIEIAIQKKEKPFLDDMVKLQSEIVDMFYRISIGEDYRDESTFELFKIYKFRKGINN